MALSGVVGAEESGWQSKLQAAENVTHQGHKNDSLLIRAQDSALTLGYQALDLARAEGPGSDSAQGVIFNHLGDYHFKAGRTELALAAWIEALNHFRRLPISDERVLDATQFRLSMCVDHTDLESKSYPYIDEAVKFRDSLLQTDDPLNSARLCELANFYLKNEDNAQGEAIYRKIISLWERNPTTSPEFAARGLILFAENVSKSFANINTDRHHQDSAIILGTRALQIAESVLGAHHPMVAFVLQRLGDYHARRGDYLVGEAMWKRAGEINFATLPPEHIEYQGSVHRIGCSHVRFGRYAEAEPLLLEALELRIKTKGTGHPEVASMNLVLGQFYHYTGEYIQAEKYYRAALFIRENAIESVAADIGQVYGLLGQLYSDQGRYSRAEEYFTRAYEIRRDALGPSHSMTATALKDLAGLYILWKRNGDAKILLEQVLTTASDFLGDDHPIVAATLCELATLYDLEKNSDKAIESYSRALAIIERGLGEANDQYIKAIRGLARVYEHNNNLKMAEKLYRQALAINDNFHPPICHDFVTCIDDLAAVLARQGNYTQAEELYQRGMIAAKTAAAQFHPALASLYEGYARLCLVTRRPARAMELSANALVIREANFHDGASVMAEHDVLNYARSLIHCRDLYLTAYLCSPKTVEQTRAAADIILDTKGLVTDHIIRRAVAARKPDDPSLALFVDSLMFANSRLSRMYVEGPGVSGDQLYRRVFDSLQNTKHRLESIVASRSRFYMSDDVTKAVTAAEVTQALPENSALIEYVQVDFQRDPYGPHNPCYLAMVLGPSGEPDINLLDKIDIIDPMIRDYQRQISDAVNSNGLPTAEQTQAFKSLSALICKSIWTPLVSALPDTALLLIAPDGSLNLLSFAGLAADSMNYLIQKYAIHYIASGRDFLRMDEQFTPGSGLLAIGDPDYDAMMPARIESPEALTYLDNGGIYPDRLRDLKGACDPLWQTNIPRLPGTRVEIERISDSWTEAGHGPVWTYTGKDATEENFKLNVPGKQVVHVATHGYFADRCAADSNNAKFTLSETMIEENPLLLSGLFLSGVNRRNSATGALNGEDGVVTAEEVCHLDFTGTRCVVLSACESGLGRLQTGEGVFGLRRAFQMAGARMIISSLWVVGDNATERMMSSLYTHADERAALAMRKAMLRKIEDLRARHQPDHPALWAAFISFGALESIVE